MPTRQDVAIGLSLSTLWFIGVWSDLLPFLYLSSRFPVGALPCWQDFLGVVLNVCLLGGVFAVGRALVRRAPQPVQTAAGWIFLVSLVVPLNVIRNHFHTHVEPLFSTIGPLAARTVLFLIVIGAATVIVRWRRRMVDAISTGLLILFPLVPLLFAQAAWAMSQAHGRMQCAGASTFAAALEGAPRARVIWIVYDELEEYAAFEGRPPDLALPELDRLRMESIAAAPLAPGDRTERSMPAFLVGAPVDDSMLTSRNELKLTVRGRPDVTPLTPGDTVFARARALGMNAGVAGFFLPYCSLVGPVVTTCSWQPCVTCGRMVGAFGSSVGESMANQVSELAPRYGVRRHLAGYRALQAAALALAPDRSLGFVLIHLPVPHAPPIYDRRTAHFSLTVSGESGYLDSLALVDRSLGELRRSMEANGSWTATTVILFADHGRRSLADGVSVAHPEVPFFLKLAGSYPGQIYARPFNAVLVHDLTLELLAGRLATPADVVGWLDANRNHWPVHTR
jgi:hypothetical protein